MTRFKRDRAKRRRSEDRESEPDPDAAQDRGRAGVLTGPTSKVDAEALERDRQDKIRKLLDGVRRAGDAREAQFRALHPPEEYRTGEINHEEDDDGGVHDD